MKTMIIALATLMSLTTFAKEREGFCSVGAILKNGEHVDAEDIRFIVNAPDAPTENFTDNTVTQRIDLGNSYSLDLNFMAKVTDDTASDVLLLSLQLNRGETAIALREDAVLAYQLNAANSNSEFIKIISEIRNAEVLNADATDTTIDYVIVSCYVGK